MIMRKVLLCILLTLVVLAIVFVSFFVHQANKPKGFRTVYMLPEPNADRVKILKRATTPRKQLYEPVKTESESTEVSVESSKEVDTETGNAVLEHDEDLEMLLEKIEKSEPKKPVSPFGFGEFPEIPPDFPETVIWQSDMQSEIAQYGSEQIKAVELMDRVLVKLWKQGHQATSAHTADNGMIYPSYPNTIYLDLAYKTDSEGNTVVSRGRLSGYDGITESVIDAIMEGNIPPGITVLSYSDDGIDPYSFLNLN